MYSIYHFFKSLLRDKQEFLGDRKLEDFPYDENLLSCKSFGRFPDMAIRLNPVGSPLSGGELIELKDSKSYSVSSFNSTIPTGKKSIADIIPEGESSIREQMEQVGENIHSLPMREVFYLIRGRHLKRQVVKVCLVHGSFFETMPVDRLIRSSFEQVLQERLEQTGESLSEEVKEKLIALFSIQESFSKVRDVERAAVKLRFRIMTEVKKEGNVLNTKQYPELGDNTLNLLLPCDRTDDEARIHTEIQLAFQTDNLCSLRTFKIQHPLNGTFLVLQAVIDSTNEHPSE